MGPATFIGLSTTRFRSNTNRSAVAADMHHCIRSKCSIDVTFASELLDLQRTLGSSPCCCLLLHLCRCLPHKVRLIVHHHSHDWTQYCATQRLGAVQRLDVSHGSEDLAFLLCSVHEVHVDDKQMQWFRHTLAASSHRPVCIFTHAPPMGCGLKVLNVSQQTMISISSGQLTFIVLCCI